MVLSEAEAEARLAALRQQRESIDRAITDLTLYLELGRRLTGEPTGHAAAASPNLPAPVGPNPAAPPSTVTPDRDLAERHGAERTVSTPTGPASVLSDAASPPGPDGADSADDGALSETVLARRYGRALVQAAVVVLAEAGRPMHAGEIEAVLSARGFSVPGQQDPVAALNTRLWKRSGPGGVLRRLGDAVYALPEPDGSGPISRRD